MIVYSSAPSVRYSSAPRARGARRASAAQAARIRGAVARARGAELGKFSLKRALTPPKAIRKVITLKNVAKVAGVAAGVAIAAPLAIAGAKIAAPLLAKGAGSVARGVVSAVKGAGRGIANAEQAIIRKATAPLSKDGKPVDLGTAVQDAIDKKIGTGASTQAPNESGGFGQDQYGPQPNPNPPAASSPPSVASSPTVNTAQPNASGGYGDQQYGPNPNPSAYSNDSAPDQAGATPAAGGMSPIVWVAIAALGFAVLSGGQRPAKAAH